MWGILLTARGPRLLPSKWVTVPAWQDPVQIKGSLGEGLPLFSTWHLQRSRLPPTGAGLTGGRGQGELPHVPVLHNDPSI